jgi:hypothetical protein
MKDIRLLKEVRKKVKRKSIRKEKTEISSRNKNMMNNINENILTNSNVNINQPIFYNVGNEIHGETEEDKTGHKHKFIINKNDNTVIIVYAYNPEIKNIYHNHLYVGEWPSGYITEDASVCWPDCENGLGPHNHKLTKIINNLNSN